MSESLAGLRVVVVGINYAPETTGVAPYTTAACEHLVAAGAQVTAVVGMPHYPQWSVPVEYRGRLRHEEVRSGVRVIRSAHFVPKRQGAGRRGLYEGTFALSSRWAGRALDADVVVAVSPSLSGIATGNRIARRNGVPLGVIVQDLMGKAAGQSGIGGGAQVSDVVTRLEMAGLRSADQVAVITPGFADAVVSGGVPADRVSLLPNHSHVGVSELSREAARAMAGWPSDDFVVLHTGNMGNKQDLGNVIAAARLARREASRMRFLFVGDGNQRTVLEEAARGLENVAFLDPVSDELYPILLRAADVLLVNERPTVVNMSLPSKLTSYFAAGRPVVAAVPTGGSTYHEMARSGGGITVPAGDSTMLLSTIQTLMDAPSRRDQLGRAGQAYADAELSAAAAHRRLDTWVATLAGIELAAVEPVSQVRAPNPIRAVSAAAESQPTAPLPAPEPATAR